MATISLTQISNGDNGDATTVDNNFDTIANEINGNLSNANISASAAIAFSKLAADAWTAFTPSWTNLTTGNGTLDEARYVKVGRYVAFSIKFTWGSTTSISAGDVSFSLPVAAGASTDTFFGDTRYTDASSGIVYIGEFVRGSTTVGTLRVHKADATYLTRADVSATVPITWTTSDVIHCRGFYESAS